ncbi:MAG: D-alanyl-D-alanine carboxypeptidase [Alphaproteobacteria bacterium]|nr:D-alanyl-D-alanine carboxypeptidase [Alphaproteobacteria bacterium]MBP9877182.1 D-alanyl-D-alanine carboxypeptidase [Alphaproteobacteria bacterium]
MRQFNLTTMRKGLFGLLTSIMLVGSACAYAAPQFETEADQAILVDLATDTIVYEKNARDKMYPSSMSKVMTMFVIFDKLKAGEVTLNDKVSISEKAWRMGGSKTFVGLGEEIPLEDLIRGVIVQSGNDASVAIAEGVSADEEFFAQEMNDTAEQLGMVGSHFKNATGMPDADHYSTAYDLALLAKTMIYKFPEFYHYWSETEYTHNNIRQPNRNPLLYKTKGADGLKTGHTDAGGYGLIGSAERDGRRLLIVVNGLKSTKQREAESSKLLEWGFREFDVLTIPEKEETVKEVKVLIGSKNVVKLAYGADPKFTVPRLSIKKAKFEFSVPDEVPAPVKKGQKIGSVKMILPDANADQIEIDLVAAEDVDKAGWFKRFFLAIGRFFASIFG